ncbi:hypothetical protein BpHYR1_032041 [Brachionus plicatilis]|uniref:Uncharacterized protein n=1 Tax=Brachionus plicatilis TaxID=10195 RepID=A0A3M7PKN7_BRAPC|nr:hypothetical protein BpHYR1_032041 [Brachionus plicatilis]
MNGEKKIIYKTTWPVGIESLGFEILLRKNPEDIYFILTYGFYQINYRIWIHSCVPILAKKRKNGYI